MAKKVKKKPAPLWMKKVMKRLPLIVGFGIFFTFYVGGFIAQFTGYLTGEVDIGFGILHCIFANFKYGFQGVAMMALIYCLIAGWIFLRWKDKHMRETSTDERGFEMEESGTYGTAAMLDMEEAREYVEVEPLNKTKGFVIGKFITDDDETGLEQVVSVPPDGKRFSYDAAGRPIMEKGPDGKKVQKRERIKFNGNRHMMVVGPSGSGKSYTFVRTNIFQSILQGESVIVTDPKGEMYADTSEFAREHGYVVRIFNLFWPAGSDAVHFLGEVQGDQIGIEAQAFANIVIANTENPGGGGDAAYTNGEKNLLCALVLYVLTAPNCIYPKTFGGVYQLLCEPLETIEGLFDLLPRDNPALGPWSIFKDGSESFRGNLRTGLGNRLTVLNDSVIKNITGGDENGINEEIDLTLPGKAKCAYYVIMDDMEDTFKFLSSLFFTYLINRLVKYSRRQMTGKLPVNVNLIMDEFIAIGRLPDFEKKLATVRSAGIAVSMIFQNKPQLDAAYPDGLSDTIIGNCSTILCLACNDMATAQFLSDRSGIATIALDQTRVSRPVVQLGAVPTELSHSYSLGQRAVLNPDEITRLDPGKVLVVITSANVFMADKFPFTDIVDPKTLHQVNIYNHVPAWREKRSYKPTENKQDEDESYSSPSPSAQPSIIPNKQRTAPQVPVEPAFSSPAQQVTAKPNPQSRPSAPRVQSQQNVQRTQQAPARQPSSAPVKAPVSEPMLVEDDEDVVDPDSIVTEEKKEAPSAMSRVKSLADDSTSSLLDF